MKLSELISMVGDESIQFQNLETSLISANKSKNGPIKITFGTEAVSTAELIDGKFKKLGLIVWLPKDKLPKGMNQ